MNTLHNSQAPSPASEPKHRLPLDEAGAAAPGDALRLPSPGTSIPGDGSRRARSRMRAAHRWARPS